MVARPEVRGVLLDPGGFHRLERLKLELPDTPSATGSGGPAPPPLRP
jgi:hypothetical protein